MPPLCSVLTVGQPILLGLKMLNVSAIIAVPFARLFYRNAINVGLGVIALPRAGDIAIGDEVTVDLRGAKFAT